MVKTIVKHNRVFSNYKNKLVYIISRMGPFFARFEVIQSYRNEKLC